MKAQNLCLKYGDKEIYKNLSFEIKGGDIVGVKGENGSGKTSLCLVLAGLLKQDEDIEMCGDILYDGKKIQDLTVYERAIQVGIIFQNPENQLFSSLCSEEFAFALENLCVTRQEMKERIEKVLNSLKLGYLVDKKTSELSGGEKQLVAICALLIMRPKLLICDEITSHIDIENKVKIRNVLKAYAQEGNSILFVSHNPNDLMIANKILRLEKGKDYSQII